MHSRHESEDVSALWSSLPACIRDLGKECDDAEDVRRAAWEDVPVWPFSPDGSGSRSAAGFALFAHRVFLGSVANRSSSLEQLKQPRQAVLDQLKRLDEEAVGHLEEWVRCPHFCEAFVATEARRQGAKQHAPKSVLHEAIDGWASMAAASGPRANYDALLDLQPRVLRALLSLVRQLPTLPDVPYLFYAVSRKSPRAAVSLLLDDEGGSADVNRPGPCGDTSLQQACLHGDAALVELLLAHGADPTQCDAGRMAPLHWACIAPKEHGADSGERRASVVRMLLAAKADTRAAADESNRRHIRYCRPHGSSDSGELTPLLFARSYELDAVRRLLGDSECADEAQSRAAAAAAAAHGSRTALAGDETEGSEEEEEEEAKPTRPKRKRGAASSGVVGQSHLQLVVSKEHTRTSWRTFLCKALYIAEHERTAWREAKRDAQMAYLGMAVGLLRGKGSSRKRSKLTRLISSSVLRPTDRLESAAALRKLLEGKAFFPPSWEHALADGFRVSTNTLGGWVAFKHQVELAAKLKMPGGMAAAAHILTPCQPKAAGPNKSKIKAKLLASLDERALQELLEPDAGDDDWLADDDAGGDLSNYESELEEEEDGSEAEESSDKSE